MSANQFSLDGEILKRILDDSYDEIFILDKNDQVVYVNSACEKHYGMKQSEVIGASLPELIKYWTPCNSTSIVRKEKRRITLIQETHLGKKLVSTATPVFDDQGEVEFVIYNSRDLDCIENVVKGLEETREMLSIQSPMADNEKGIPEFIVHSKEMKQILEFAEQVADVDSTVLILGESGTGKGVLARYIHRKSQQSKGPFLELNCAAIPEELLESELFGYCTGAFTGAAKRGKKGLIELAEGGTLFLDEIGELSLRLQAKILQVIQDKQFISVGDTTVKQAKVRIIAATNQDLRSFCSLGKFRLDLYYRLNVLEITIPALRERPDDIIPLTYFFLNKFNKKYHKNLEISRKAIHKLCNYTWPGNVRELENVIARAVITVREFEIDTCHMPRVIAELDTSKSQLFPTNSQLEMSKSKIEKDIITQAYQEYGSTRKVAKALNISHSKAARLINKYCKAK